MRHSLQESQPGFWVVPHLAADMVQLTAMVPRMAHVMRTAPTAATIDPTGTVTTVIGIGNTELTLAQLNGRGQAITPAPGLGLAATGLPIRATLRRHFRGRSIGPGCDRAICD